MAVLPCHPFITCVISKGMRALHNEVAYLKFGGLFGLSSKHQVEVRQWACQQGALH